MFLGFGERGPLPPPPPLATPLWRSRLMYVDVLLVLRDLSAAFDTPDSVILLRRFNSYNICGAAPAWFASHLYDRTSVVRVKKDIGDQCHEDSCSAGVGRIHTMLTFTWRRRQRFSYSMESMVHNNEHHLRAYDNQSNRCELSSNQSH